MRTLLLLLASLACAVSLALVPACSSSSPPGGGDGPDAASLDGDAPDQSADPRVKDAGDDGPDGAISDSGHAPSDSGADATDAGSGATDSGADASDAGADASDSGADGSDSAVGPSDSGTGASDSGGDASDSGGGASDSGTGASDSGGGAGDGSTGAADGGVFAAGTYSCGTCDGGACGGQCAPGTLLCGGACVVAGAAPQNCGACGHACAASEVCLLGACTARTKTVLASGISGGTHLALDAQNVYFVDAAGVHAVPRAGGAVKDLAPATGTPLRVAVDATYVYWSENSGGAIMRAPKDGSGAPALVATATQPKGLVVVGSTVYWVTDAPKDANVYQAPASGGAASVFLALNPLDAFAGLDDIVSLGTNLYVADQSSGSFTDGGLYQIPILANGTAGTPLLVQSITHVGFSAGRIAARPGNFCGFFSGVGTLGFQCRSGFEWLPSYPSVQSGFTLPACGLAYAIVPDSKTPGATYVLAERDLLSGNAAPQTLSPDSAVFMASDGLTVYFLDTAGELRVLPIP